MLDIPHNLKKPEKRDYKVSDYDLDAYRKAKEQLRSDQYEKKKKNEKSSFIVAIIVTWFVAYIVLSMFANKNFNPTTVFFIATIIAVIIGPIVSGYFMSAAEKTTYNPRLVSTPNQNATKAYDDALELYKKTTERLKSRYPDIEKIDFDSKQYIEFVTNELARLINMKFDFENIRWWKGQPLNFKTCIIKILRKMGYDNFSRTDNIRDPIDASRSYTFDLSASRNGKNIIVRCFNTTNGDLKIEHIKVLREALYKFENATAILATNYRLGDISDEIIEFGKQHNIEIWDVGKLLDLTREYFLYKKGEPNIDLPTGFVHKLSYNISRTIGDELLTTRAYHYYVLTNELFENKQDAFAKISSYPQGNIYYGVCEYPRKWQYRGSICVYGIIACSSKDGSIYRMAKECAYLFDADSREYITNNYQSSLGRRSKYMPFV